MLNYYFNSGHSEETLKQQLKEQIDGCALAFNGEVGLYKVRYGPEARPVCTLDVLEPKEKKKDYHLKASVDDSLNQKRRNNLDAYLQRIIKNILVLEGTAHTLETVH